MKKYNLNINHLENHGGIHKLERDGFSRQDIHNALYKATRGATQQERTKIIERLYDRQESK